MSDEETCAQCGEEAVIYRKYEGRGLCKDHFSQSINKQVKKLLEKATL